MSKFMQLVSLVSLVLMSALTGAYGKAINTIALAKAPPEEVVQYKMVDRLTGAQMFQIHSRSGSTIVVFFKETPLFRVESTPDGKELEIDGHSSSNLVRWTFDTPVYSLENTTAYGRVLSISKVEGRPIESAEIRVTAFRTDGRRVFIFVTSYPNTGKVERVTEIYLGNSKMPRRVEYTRSIGGRVVAHTSSIQVDDSGNEMPD